MIPIRQLQKSTKASSENNPSPLNSEKQQKAYNTRVNPILLAESQPFYFYDVLSRSGAHAGSYRFPGHGYWLAQSQFLDFVLDYYIEWIYDVQQSDTRCLKRYYWFPSRGPEMLLIDRFPFVPAQYSQ
jgi:hypothetical protein